MPVPDLIHSSFNRRRDIITQGPGVDHENENNYFQEHAATIEDVDPALIINYDVPNMTNERKRRNAIVHRGCACPTRILYSK